MTKKLLLGGLVLLVVFAVIVAVTRGNDGDDTDTTDPVAVDHYVALGDSYSAGEGVRPYEADSGDAHTGGDNCHRSELAYSQRLAFAESQAQVVFRACSGADIVDLFERKQLTGKNTETLYGPQADDGVLSEEVDLVTVTIGGNDAGFSKVLKHCALTSNCLKKPVPNLTEGEPLQDWADSSIAGLATILPTIYEKLASLAPNARIVVIGYPNLFPSELGGNLVCRAAREFLWTEAEVLAIRNLFVRFTGTIRDATKEAAVEFVDVASFFSGHEPCAAGKNWVNFVRIPRLDVLTLEEVADAIAGLIDRGTFHPNRLGQLMLARIVACHYNRALEETPEPVISVVATPSPSAAVAMTTGSNAVVLDCALGQS